MVRIVSNTAEKIVTVALEILEAEGGESVTMRRVAKRVGVTPMALYHHFPDRAALLNAMANRGFDELARALAGRRFEGGLETRLIKMADIHLEHALEHPCLFELMFLAKRSSARRYPQDFKAGKSPTGSLLAGVLAEGMKAGQLKRGDPWEIAFQMGALSHGLIMLYLGGRIDVPPAEFRSLHRRSFKTYAHGIFV
jgi:AcrR family transcriptional regulator